MNNYIADQSWPDEWRRLRDLECALDNHTTRHLELLGVDAGMSCLEIGAGSGSIARWFCERVGSTGHVVATDLDVTLLAPLANTCKWLSVRREDIAESVPAAPTAYGFDRAHARLVLGHIAHPQDALKNVLAALRPGGLALIEDADFLWSDVGELPCYPETAAVKCFPVWRATVQHMQSRGYAVHWGRRLAAAMRAAGFEQVRGEAVILVGDAALQSGMRRTIQRFAAALVESGAVTRTEVDACCDALADPELTFTGSPTFSVWGTRPLRLDK